MLLASSMGAMLGLALALPGRWVNLGVGAATAGCVFFSILVGNGIYVPLVLIFAFVYVRMELPLRSAASVSVLMWWNVYPLLEGEARRMRERG